MKTKKLLTLLLALLLKNTLSAQNFYAPSHEEQFFFSFGMGSAGYYGDLQDEFILPSFSFTTDVSYRTSPYMRLRGSLSWFLLNASDKNSPEEDFQIRNLSFQSNNFELSANIEFQLVPQYSYRHRERVQPFISLGIGLVNVNPTTRYKGKKYRLRELKTEGVRYGAVAIAIPLGLGVRLKMNRHISIVADFGYRITNSDYLDDVSTDYPDLLSLPTITSALSDRRQEMGLPPAKKGGQRGNPERNDGYFLLSFRIEGKLSYLLRR